MNTSNFIVYKGINNSYALLFHIIVEEFNMIIRVAQPFPLLKLLLLGK